MVKLDKFNLTDEQRQVLSVMQSGRNVHIYGEAGTGKSFVLQKFIRSLSDAELAKTIVAAPTGIAAINVGGATLHRAFRIPITLLNPYKPVKVSPTVKAARRIIIDEYSMMRFDIFDYVSRVIFKAEQKNNWNIQLILVGDALQLPPVIRNEEYTFLHQIWKDLIPNIEHGYPFIHPNWQKFDFVDCHLTKIIRQSGDEELIRNENLARAGDSRCLEWFAQNTAKKMDTKAIHICPTNRMANGINEMWCRQFKDRVIFKAETNGSVGEQDKITSDVLELAPGMRVMSVVNSADLEQYQNGSLGTVVAVEPEVNSVEVKFDNGFQTPIAPYTWDICNYEVKDSKIIKKVVGQYRQIPLRIAYAVTIHKSQGQTYDKVIIHPECFEVGQLYVALSRCRTREGIFIAGKLKPDYLMVADDALEFYDNLGFRC